jgi:hypothetical protein
MMEPNRSVFSKLPTDYDQQLTLLDEQEQQDTVYELFQMALNQKKHAERIMAAMGLFFPLSTACATVYHAYISLRPLSMIAIKQVILLSYDDESKKEFVCNITFVLGGLYSAYMHLLSAARNISIDANDEAIYCLSILTNPLRLARRVLRSLLLNSKLENEEKYFCVNRHPGAQVVLLFHDSILLLLSFISPLIFVLITHEMIQIPSTSTFISAMSYCNILTALCSIYLRRETRATLSSIEQLHKNKYHYKSL